ncbi:ubiquitin-conjugating enzyme E2 R1 [Neophocaena asiaeorientalis asiaeorientalis]|uniref:E2 ubiquitin-conjugating enzyme n=1 Tax=Neophocaena asiaeorientalis asiaeorientalis TaxID=1706337 RepID=A0A341B1U5_NEOAA|nr:ubiquitin-conjugating enzyme E2 R1 [Neophocaena asiaeorientalis asiaeorientalis]
MGAEGIGAPSEVPWRHSPETWEAWLAPSLPSTSAPPQQFLPGPRLPQPPKGESHSAFTTATGPARDPGTPVRVTKRPGCPPFRQQEHILDGGFRRKQIPSPGQLQTGNGPACQQAETLRGLDGLGEQAVLRPLRHGACGRAGHLHEMRSAGGLMGSSSLREATTGLECHAHPPGELSPADVQGWRPGPIPTLRSRAVRVSGPGARPGPLVPSSQKALLLELKGLQEEPVEGFRVTLVDEGDLYNWEVAIFGPPNTYYEGGYFKARLKFPIDYPYSPPAFRFLTKMWHPNIYETGDVCISILHPPVDDPQSGELPSERWNPTQNVRTILLSVISLLNEPNTFSPANVDASVMYRKWKESKGKDREYTDIIRKQVLGTKVDAERDGVKVPTTLAEYCVKTKAPAPDEGSDLFYDDYYEDAEAEAEADSCFGDEDDSGTEES